MTTECCNAANDSFLCSKPGHIGERSIIDSGSALRHFVYLTVEKTRASTSLLAFKH